MARETPAVRLYAEAAKRVIRGRSRMTKDELKRALAG